MGAKAISFALFSSSVMKVAFSSQAANEDHLEALEERKEEHEASFESLGNHGYGIGGFGDGFDW